MEDKVRLTPLRRVCQGRMSAPCGGINLVHPFVIRLSGPHRQGHKEHRSKQAKARRRKASSEHRQPAQLVSPGSFFASWSQSCCLQDIDPRHKLLFEGKVLILLISLLATQHSLAYLLLTSCWRVGTHRSPWLAP